MGKEIVINGDYGGFSLSFKGMMYYAKLKGIKLYAFIWDYKKCKKYEEYNGKESSMCIHYSTKKLVNGEIEKSSYFSDGGILRDDIDLVKTVKDLGKEANGLCASLKIVTIPSNIDWQIEEYEGSEWISEKHQTWR